MNIVEYLDAEKDIAALAALIRGNKLRWLEEISNTEIWMTNRLSTVC